MSNFHIGQECVTLASSNRIKEGTIVTILQARKSTCNCSGSEYDIGDRDGNIWVRGCSICGGSDHVATDVIWWHESEIAPLQTKSEEEDMNEAIEEALSQPAFQ